MDKTKVITTLCELSGLDIESSSYSLLAKIQQHLKRDLGLDEIATYTHDLSVLTDLLVCLSNTKVGHEDKTEIEKDGRSRIQLNQDVVESVCFPLLGRLYPASDLRPEVHVLLGIVGKLAAHCVQEDDRILSNVLQFVAVNVDKFIVEKPTEYEIKNNDSLIDIYVLLEILRHVLNSISHEHVQKEKVGDLVRLLFFKLTETLEFISLEAIGSSCIPNLLRILRLDNSSAQKYLEYVWKYIEEFSHLSDRRKQYMLLCGFANYFFPVSGKTACLDLRANNTFWKILQEGLYNKDTINRKRSLYLLKRIVDICDSTKSEVNVGVGQAVFWWSKEKCGQLSKLWEDFILLAEVFEEKQVHVIKPLLPRMKTLVNACARTDKTVIPLLHTSWLTTILLRCSIHESLQVNRWMADTVLSLDFTQCPMMEQGSDQYLAGPMLYSLREAKLHVREPGSPVGTMPVIAEKLIQFFSNCSQVLDDSKRALFFSRTVENISAGEWGPIPLLCICRGLSQVPPSPCLDRDTILGLRKLLTGYLVAMDTYFRGAIQGYVVQILIKLTDKCKVRLEDFMQILSLANREESFRRGTPLWDQCVAWLHAGSNEQSEWNTEGIQQYLEASVTKYLQTDLDSKYSTADSSTSLMVARLLLLASDAAIATKMDDNNSNTLIRITQMIVTTLNSINSHAYMSTHKADKALLLLNLLVKECSNRGQIRADMVIKVVFDSVSACQSEVLMYISRQMCEAILTMSDLSLLELYTDSVKLLVESMSINKSVKFETLVDSCLTVLSQPVETSDLHGKLQHLSAMCFLGTLANFLSHDLQKSHDQMKSGDQKASQDPDRSGHTDLRIRICCVLKKWKLVSNFPKPTGDQSLSQQEWGKVSSLFLEHQWNVVQMALLHGADPWCDMLELLTLAEDSLTVGVERTSVILLKCLRIIIPQVKDSITEERLVSVLGTCWSSFQESRRILAFWDVLEAFVQTAYHSCLLQLSDDSPVISALKLYANQLIQIGTDKNGVVNILASQICRAWSEPNMILHAGKFTSLIVDLCMFGSLVRRGVRQIYEICAAFEGEGNACPAHGLIKGVVNEDILVRVNIINFLCRLKPDNQSHCCLATSIIRLCIKTYDDVACGCTNRFANSLVHRQRHRLIQTVLLLQPFVTKDYADELWTNLWLSLETETQPSVRHVLEWVAMFLMFRYQHFRQQLWLLFRKYQETKNLTLCSLLCIVIHMGPHLPPDDQTSYFRQAIPNILPWCMAHHFHTRIYSSAVLAKLWEQCKLLGLNDVLEENAILNCIVDFSQQNCNSTRNVQKLLDSFFFKYLDFERDFTLETIYTVMSQMTSLTEEDWIYPELFENNGSQWKDGTGSSFIKLCNEVRDFEQCEPGLWKYISLKAPYEEETTVESAADDNDRDVQKKVMPWRQMMLDEEAMLEVEHGVKQHIEGGLIVVTSLISKVPNLGGLCRTSEIFGVSEYVLGKMGYVNDKAFQGLSVTAHMWVPITEVNESKLEDYLQQKREEGYTLVGVEQTANSVCLTEYTFPEKTLLLLGRFYTAFSLVYALGGIHEFKDYESRSREIDLKSEKSFNSDAKESNEKEGIPVELISLLDVCVEIPQQGVVRSLNVHVSGAILIWEYRRQQLMKAVSS